MQQKIKNILNSGWAGALVITGGGCGVIGRLLENGGGSSFLQFAHVPYSRESLKDFIKITTTQSVSEETVGFMIDATLNMLLRQSGNRDKKIINVACSAKLMSDGEREGREHKAFVCIAGFGDDESNYIEKTYTFSPSSKTRIEQERELEDFIIEKINEFITNN